MKKRVKKIMNNFIAKEGLKYIYLAFALTIFSYIFVCNTLAIILFCLSLFLVYIYRNNILTKAASDSLVSVTDGKIFAIDKTKEFTSIYIEVGLIDSHILVAPKDANYKKVYEKHGLNLSQFSYKAKELNNKRKEFIEKLIKEHSIEKVIEIANNLETPGFVGHALAGITLSEENENKLYELLKSDKNEDISLIQSYIYPKDFKLGQEKTLETFNRLLNDGSFNNESLAKYLLALRFDVKLWKYIGGIDNPEIEKYYWENFNPQYVGEIDQIEFSINKLIQYKRTIAVLNLLGQITEIKTLDSEFVMTTLEKLSLTDYVEHSKRNLDHYGLTYVFDNLFSRDDIDSDRMAKIEFKYLFVFDSTGHGILPKFLFTAISKDPVLFMDLIQNVYKPENREFTEEEEDKLKDPNQKVFIEYSNTLLWNFNLIPGLSADGNIDSNELNNWVDKVREISKECDRVGSTDEKIGQILARYPNKEQDIFFPDEICDTIERINSKDVYLGFRIQISNRLGFTSRAAGAGGDIERARAKHFHSLAEKRKISHPNVASVYRYIAENYERDGERMDNRAIQDSLS